MPKGGVSTRYKPFIALLALILVAVSLAGCGGKPAVKHLRYSVGAEPETLDPRKSTGSPEANIEEQIFEGLTTLNAKDLPVPAVAEKWEVSADGLRYTFFLRGDAKWSNGDPVTAEDFEYAWKSALSPELGSKYAYQLFYLKNGEAYNKGEAPASAVGVRAVNPRTLEITLEEPTTYFLSLTAFHTYYPVHKSTAQTNEKWAADPKTFIGNGPFKVVSWAHNSKIEFAKNDFYWDAAKVKMTKMEFFLNDNANTELDMFENNQIDMGGNPPVAEFPRLLREGKLKVYPYIGTYFYSFNVTKPPFDNPLVRRAFALAIDREAIIKNITRGEQKAALAWVPFGLPDAKSDDDFRIKGGDFFKDNDSSAAQKLLADAGYPGGRGLPPVTLIYNTSEGHKAIAEAIQEMWKKNLGVSVTLANQEWKVFLSTRSKGDYQVARHGWIGDYADPMTFIDMFVSDGGNNDAQYKNPAYDRLVRLAKTTNDPAARMQAMHDAEKILMEDGVIAPIYFYTNAILAKPNVKGYIRSVLGQLYFKEAYIE
ncbi:MAG: peptide ABC transporter substrate-binding protein [Negativicutes bacterium]|nr:peptide ABC transporter substrate-binding protein [Negativicutes bacterium]